MNPNTPKDWEKEFNRIWPHAEHCPMIYGNCIESDRMEMLGLIRLTVSLVEQDAIRRTEEHWTIHLDGDIYMLHKGKYQYVGYLAHEGTVQVTQE